MRSEINKKGITKKPCAHCAQNTLNQNHPGFYGLEKSRNKNNTKKLSRKNVIFYKANHLC